MCARPTFSEDDVGKAVENVDETTIGVVASVDAERDTARVEPNPDVIDSIKAAFGWESDDDGAVPIDASAVREITEEAIRLEDRRSSIDERDAESVTSDEGHDAVVEQHEGPGERGAGSETGEFGGAESERREEADASRHPDSEESPPEGDRTVTDERGRDEDRSRDQ